MTDTGWKHPTMVTQDSRKELNGGLSCYPFTNLNNIKKDDKSYADQQPWAYTGIDSAHKSPMIYAYNYGFKLPTNATVDKITLFVLIQQLTHPKYYYEHYVLKRQLRFSTSKFCNVKLKVGTSTIDGGSGTQFAEKCKVPMLPYKSWSTEDMTTFEGTPKEWGIDSKDVVSIVNNSNFGAVIQVVGTVKNGWCSPGIAQMRMKIDYTIPEVKPVTPSTFNNFTVHYKNSSGVIQAITFDSKRVSNQIIELDRSNYAIPVPLIFKYTHIGLAGETPYIVLNSTTLGFSSDMDGYTKKTVTQSKFTVPKLQCGKDETAKEYTQYIYVFAGVNAVGDVAESTTPQEVTYTYGGLKYTIRFNVVDSSLSGVDRYRFVDQNNVCIIQNCLFYRNHALGVGGANFITSEYYNAKGNIYGTGDNKNIADNNKNENNGRACPNTYWLNECYDNK